MTANEDLLHGQVAHQINLQRYSKNVVSRILSLLDKSERQARIDLIGRFDNIIERGSDLGPVTTQRLNDLIKSFGAIRASAYKSMGETLKGEMVDLASYESAFQQQALKKAIAVDLSVVIPTLTQLKNIATRQPFRGRLLREWVKDLSVSDRKGFSDAIKVGMAENLTAKQIARRVTSRIGISRFHAEAITRTAINHVSSAAFNEVGRANEDIVEGQQWLSTLDGRTSDICIDLDGKIFSVNSGRRPPAHIRCRSTMTYVLKSWKKMGIDLKEAPPGTRASLNGQVPDRLTYKEWLKTQPASFQDEVLGKTKGALFRDGDMSVASRFTDASGKSYTLDQLKKRERVAWNKAFVDPNVPAGMETVDRDKAIEYVKDRGQATKTEHAVVFSSTGDAVLVKSGKKREVSFNDTEVRRIRAADGAELVHNHPNGTTLSGADLDFAVATNIKQITAVGTSEGSEFIAIPKVGSRQKLGRAVDLSDKLVGEALRKGVLAGQLDGSTANAVHYHVINRTLHEAGFIDYRVVTPNKALADAEKVLDTGRMDQIINIIAGEIKQWL